MLDDSAVAAREATDPFNKNQLLAGNRGGVFGGILLQRAPRSKNRTTEPEQRSKERKMRPVKWPKEAAPHEGNRPKMTNYTNTRERPLVLVVDDDRTIAELVSAALVRNNYRPIMAYDGEEGLEMAQVNKPLAIVLDWMMPGKNGIEVLKELKKDPQTESIPVLMLTSKRMINDVLTAIQAGVAEYVTKPFEMSEFTTRFNKMILQFGDSAIVLDKLRNREIA